MKSLSFVVALSIAGLASPAWAGPYADDLAKCLVSSTSPADKASLVRWVFATAALHPEVASIAVVSSEQRTEMNRTVGALFTRLLTVTCRTASREALQYEGLAAIQTGFQVLGQVAMSTLLSHSAVAQGFSEFRGFVDEKAVEDLRRAKD